MPIASASRAVPGTWPAAAWQGQRAIGDELALRNQDHAGDREDQHQRQPEQGIDRAVGDAVLQQEQHDRRVQDRALPLRRRAARGLRCRRPPITQLKPRCRYLIWWITIINYNLKAWPVDGAFDLRATYRDCEPRAMTVSKTAARCRQGAPRRPQGAGRGGARKRRAALGELSELLGYSLKRAQLKVFEDFLRCVAPLQLTPAQFSVLLLLDKNPGRNQTEIASTLGILRPNFVAMLDGLESRDCARGCARPTTGVRTSWC